MKALSVVILLAAGEVAAAQCLPPDPPVGGTDLTPLGCAVTVYVSPQSADFDPAPRIDAHRGFTAIDVTGQVQIGSVDIPMTVIAHDGNCNQVTQTVPVAYFVFTFELVGAQVGDELVFADTPVGTVVAPSSCTLPQPPTIPTCDARNPGCDDIDPIDSDPIDDDAIDDGGCNAGGASSGLLALLVLLGCRRRPTRV